MVDLKGNANANISVNSIFTKKAISVAKTSSNIYKLKIHRKTINSLIYSKQQKKTIKKEIKNLENHQA